jgi:hypothetical protein
MREASNIEAARPRRRLVASTSRPCLARARNHARPGFARARNHARPGFARARNRALQLALALIALAQLGSLPQARAEPELMLRWSAPSAGCPDAAWAEARIAAQLGRAPARDVAHGVTAIVQIATTPRGFTLSLQTTFQAQAGARTLEGTRCEELGDAAILIISLSVSEASEQIAAASLSAPATGANAPARAGAAKEREPARAQPTPSLGGFVRADAVLQVGLWDRVALGPGLSLGLTRGIFRGEIGGIWYPPLTLHHSGRDIEASLGTARALGCLLFGRGRVQGGGCAGVEFGGARTHTVQSGTKANSWWSAVTLGGRLNVRLIARLSVVASADVLVGLTRLRFSSEDEATGQPIPLYTAKPVQLRASLGPELRF